LVGFGYGEPGLAREPDMARMQLVADLVERQRALADEPTVDARRERLLVATVETLADERPDEDHPGHRDDDRQDRLRPPRAVGDEEGEDPGDGGAAREEDREERRARELEHEQREGRGAPEDVQRHDLMLGRSRRNGVAPPALGQRAR